MIVYLDTSAFLKLYLEESNSSVVHRAIAASTAVCTHLITYAEMRAALAQAGRMERIPRENFSCFIDRFEKDWLSIEIVAVDLPLVRRAGGLAERFALRGYDSVHLAAAERVFEASIANDDFLMIVFDRALCAAAEALGITTTD